MVSINYEIPDDLHRQLKIRAAEEGVTLKDLIVRYLEEGLDA
jgi:plasmid stability protein